MSGEQGTRLKSETPHKNLEAWKASMDLVEEIYKLTSSFPTEEKFGLVSQMRRAAVSVPSNIAEGAANRTTGQFINFLTIALGSLAELDTQLAICHRLSIISHHDNEKVNLLLDRTKGLTFGLLKSIKKRDS